MACVATCRKIKLTPLQVVQNVTLSSHCQFLDYCKEQPIKQKTGAGKLQNSDVSWNFNSKYDLARGGRDSGLLFFFLFLW